ncbi:MAG: RNA polymerase sigma factor [Acidimicrobiales bacterium]
MGTADLGQWLEEGYGTSFRTAYLILGNRADAEEAVQEAFLRAWRFRDSLGPVTNLKPWLYRVVVNACCSKLHREVAHRSRRAPAAELDALASPTASPDEEVGHAQLSMTVMNALNELPVHLRVPVVLRYYGELSEREIAVAIGRRQGTVKSRLHEARRRLAGHPGLRALVDTAPADQDEGART